jgi:hypothetical protein
LIPNRTVIGTEIGLKIEEKKINIKSFDFDITSEKIFKDKNQKLFVSINVI